MKKNQIMEFEPRERILEKARKYVDSLEPLPKKKLPVFENLL